MAKHETLVASYVLYFKESLRGMSVGAPVTYQGLPVGEVTAVGFEYNETTDRIRPRVDIVVYPARFAAYVKTSVALEEKIQSEKKRHGIIQKLIDRGVRAQLRSGSLLTGQLYVAFDRFPNAPKATVDWTKEPPELPVMPSNMQELESKINSIVAKIEKMPLDAIGEDLKKLLETTDQLMSRIDEEIVPELKRSLEELQALCWKTRTPPWSAKTPRRSRSCGKPCRRSPARRGRSVCSPNTWSATPTRSYAERHRRNHDEPTHRHRRALHPCRPAVGLRFHYPAHFYTLSPALSCARGGSPASYRLGRPGLGARRR